MDSFQSPSIPIIRAAQYVRMSTEHQQYSTENQRDVIRDYAFTHGYEIVKTYADDGKSGLRIEGRHALQQLMEDVRTGKADFNAILVYDISRWGRFQDSDEGAFYEHTCKRAGIRVVYCAEQFENDGSPISTIIKGVKRAMAGEYSRELSAKVFKGQCRLIQLGYRQGGPAGFGLRRMLIDQNGKSKAVLKRGEQKSLQTDRVILVPGPPDEVAVVHRIYQHFTKEGKREIEIAEILRRDGLVSETGRPWTRSMVHQILTNEKYIGNNVYNRISFKLKKKRIRNTPDMWIRADGVFEGVVDPAMFYMARGIIQERHRVYSDADLIDHLRMLLTRADHLTSTLIDETEGMPSSSIYRSRFGSLLEAYKLAGYDYGRDYGFLEVNRRLRALYPTLLDETTRQLEDVGARVTRHGASDHLLINDEFTASLVMTRCRHTPRGSLRWHITLDRTRMPDITIVARLDGENEEPVDFYLLPMIDSPIGRLRLKDRNGLNLDGYRFDSLHYFAEMASRVRIEVAA